jgi:hypothetical protein
MGRVLCLARLQSDYAKMVTHDGAHTIHAFNSLSSNALNFTVDIE